MLSVKERDFIRLTYRCLVLLAIACSVQSCNRSAETEGSGSPEPPQTTVASDVSAAETPAPAQIATPQEALQTSPPLVAPANLLVNGDFSNWQNNWVYPWNKNPWARIKIKRMDEKYNGNPVAQFVPPGDVVGIFLQAVPVEKYQVKPGDLFKASVSLRAETPDVVSLVLYARVRTTKGDEDIVAVQKAYYANGEWKTIDASWSPAPSIQSVIEIRFCIWAKENSTKPIDVSNASLELARAAR